MKTLTQLFTLAMMLFIAPFLHAQGTFATVAELQAATFPVGMSGMNALVFGRFLLNDGGGGLFTYDSSSTASTNNWTIFKPNSTTGRWLRHEELPLSLTNTLTLGYRAGISVTTNVPGLIAIGPYALASDTNTPSSNTGVGHQAGRNTIFPGLTTAFGFNAGVGNTIGIVTAMGDEAAAGNTTGTTTAFGYGAGRDNATNRVSAFGYYTGASNKVAFTGFGNTVGYHNVTGQITGFGESVGYYNTIGDVTAFGYESAHTNTTGTVTSLGNGAARWNTTGRLLAIGYHAGYGVDANNAPVTDIGGILIGDNANRSVVSATVLTNYIGIGDGVIVDKANQVKLGTPTITETVLYGTVIVPAGQNFTNVTIVGSTQSGLTNTDLTLNRIVLGGGASAPLGVVGSLGTTATVLHGNAAGAPTFGAVALGSDVSGTLPVTSGGTSSNSWTTNGLLFASTTTILSNGTNVWWDGQSFVVGRGTGGAAMRDANGSADAVQDFGLWDTSAQGGNLGASLGAGAVEWNFGMLNAAGNNIRRAVIALGDIDNTTGSETGGIIFGVRSAAAGIYEAWRITPAGIFQAGAAQTIQAAGTLIFNTTAANGNVALTFNGSGGLTVGGGTAIKSALSATATLDYGSILAAAFEDLTITVTGAVVNDAVSIGLPAAPSGSINFYGFVSAGNTVTIRAQNVGTIAIDPASATYRATVIHY